MKTSTSTSTWIWWCITMIMMIMMPSFAMEEVEFEEGRNQNYRTITYDVGSGNKGYMNFLKDLRNAVSATKVCNIQTLSNTPNYIYVALKANRGAKTITVALQTTDLYVLGYTDHVSNRARFFKEVNRAIINLLFTDIQTKDNTRLSESYTSLVADTRFNRNSLDLKLTTIQEVFDEVYQKSILVLETKVPNRGMPEANFFFVMCQMIAEATRFKNMENAITSKQGTIPKSLELREFQTNWNKAAKAIHEANASKPKCQNLPNDITINKKVYKTVDSLRKKIAVIKAKK